jgi:hypothetical protein
MTPRSGKAKGREFQKRVAEAIAKKFGLTIEAMSPKSVGKVVNGARYVPEGDGDLRVRQMGQAGFDIVCLTEKARRFFPYNVECKSRKTLPNPLGGWGELVKWFNQARLHPCVGTSIVVFKANRSAPYVLLKKYSRLFDTDDFPFLCVKGDLILMDFENFLEDLTR